MQTDRAGLKLYTTSDRTGAAFLPCRLLPIELVVVVFAVFAIILYSYLAIPFRVPGYLYVRKVGFGLLTYAFGLLLMFFFLRLRHIRQAMRESQQFPWSLTLAEYRSNYVDSAIVFRNLRVMHAIGAMFVVYINLKHLIPFVHGRIFDESLASLETWIFFGNSPTTLLIDLIGEFAAPLLSQGYTLFYPYVAFISVTIVLQSDALLVQRQAAGFALLWCLAILIEYALPTMGPCFSNPEIIARLPFTEVTELQQELWRQREYVLANPKSEWGVFLISGLPSLHLALVLQGSIYLQSIHRTLALLSWIFCAVTAVSTVYFGWHFVSDLLGAAVLVYVVERIVVRVVPREYCTSTTRSS